MELQKFKIIDLLARPGVSFVVPKYQRKYIWEKINWKKLIDNILSIQDRKEGLLGSVIYRTENLSGYRTLEIVDSQQRITTISLLAKAIADYDKFLTGTETSFYKEIMERILTDPFLGESLSKVKLKLSEEDNKVYSSLIEGNSIEVEDKEHRIYKAYTYFYDRIKNEKLDHKKIYESMKKVIVAEISLNDEDDAQKIFEDVNSNSAKMEQGDFIRNYIFSNQSVSIQDEIYETYWKKIKNIFSNESKELTEFLRIYLIIRRKQFIKEDEVYENFKQEFVADNLDSLKRELQAILEYAEGYNKILKANINDTEINSLIKEINSMNITPFYPVLLKCYKDYETGKLSVKDFKKILKLLISYITRRFFCELPSNAYNKINIGLLNAIREKNYIDSISKYILVKEGNSRYPTDEEFKKGFINIEIYKKNRNLRKYIIYSLENYEENEILNTEASSISLEHILPQTKNLSDTWKQDLGSDFEAIQKKWLHTIGNLALTGYNSKLGCKSFKEKLQMEHGYLSCSSRFNKGLESFDIWNEKSILKRANSLFEKALKKWSVEEYIMTDRTSLCITNKGQSNIERTEKIERKIFTLNDNWNRIKPVKAIFDGKEESVGSITNAYKYFIEQLYINYKTQFIEFIHHRITSGKCFASYEKTDRQYFELYKTGIYIGTKNNSNVKRDNLVKLVKYINLNMDIIEIIEE